MLPSSAERRLGLDTSLSFFVGGANNDLELYDFRPDPDESHNLARERPDDKEAH
jgi:hypothetical protein